jgi:hypothetical protein
MVFSAGFFSLIAKPHQYTVYILAVKIPLAYDHRMTRIRIFTKFGDPAYQPGTNRVEVDVANQFKKIGIFLNDDAFVAILEEVAFSIVAPIVPDSVASHEPPHHGGKKHYAGSHKEVKVIGHQAPGKQLYLTLGHHLGKTVQELRKVSGVPEDVLPLDAPCHHMV